VGRIETQIYLVALGKLAPASMHEQTVQRYGIVDVSLNRTIH